MSYVYLILGVDLSSKQRKQNQPYYLILQVLEIDN